MPLVSRIYALRGKGKRNSLKKAMRRAVSMSGHIARARGLKRAPPPRYRPGMGQEFYLTVEWMLLRTVILKRFGSTCMRCGSRKRIHVDHIKPRSRYPELEVDQENLQVLCQTCNLWKSNSDASDYRPAREHAASKR